MKHPLSKRIQNKFKFAFFLLFLFFSACSLQKIEYYHILEANIQTEGFLSDEIFQVRATGIPDRSLASLSELHSHSFTNAIAKAKIRMAEQMLKFRIDAEQKKMGDILIDLPDHSRIRFFKLLEPWLEKAETFYRENFSDGSVLLVFRLREPNLKGQLLRLELLETTSP